MHEIQELLVELVIKGGAYGLALAMLAWLDWLRYRGRIKELEQQNREHKADKNQLVEIIQNNTKAMTRTTGAVENCTAAIQTMQMLIQTFINRK